jgi:hypothetical protein
VANVEPDFARFRGLRIMVQEKVESFLQAPPRSTAAQRRTAQHRTDGRVLQ